MNSTAYDVGGIIGIACVVFTYVVAWNCAKKRMIGLSWMSFLMLFLTPPIALVISLFTKKIDKTKKYPTYEQRVPFENTTAILFAAILYFCFGFLFIFFVTVQFNIVVLVLGIIFVVWGYLLLKERRELLQAKDYVTTDGNKDSTNDIDLSVRSFVFDSNMQQKIESDNKVTTAHCPRRVIVEHNDKGQYRVSVIDVENNKLVLRPIIMHKLTYSSIDECESMISDDDQGEYKLNVFYKNGQVDKCVICRKSKNMMFHYCKE